MSILKKIKILVIDDYPEIRSYLKEALELKNYDVYLAESSTIGLEKIKDLGIEIVICDIIMPELSGIDFLKEIHRRHLTTQVIMMTGGNNLTSCKEAISYGTCGYLIKPFSIVELIKIIQIAERNISEKNRIFEHTNGQLKFGKTNYFLRRNATKFLFTSVFSLFLCALLIPLIYCIPLVRNLNWSIYGQLQRIENSLCTIPSGIKDIVLVLIDNESLTEISHSWPYPRSIFATVINNLKEAQPKVIAFDFAFLGSSEQKQDDLLRNALAQGPKVILGYGFDEKGESIFSSIPQISENALTGFANVIQDDDEVIRKALIYLKSENEPEKCFLSWEMQVLKTVKQIDLQTFKDNGSEISFRNIEGERWIIPINRGIGSFFIHFRANTDKFKILPFCRALKGDFPLQELRNKIILLGITTTLSGDTHNTPLGRIPGITLKANSFLNLYTHDLLRKMPQSANKTVLFIGVILACFFISFFRRMWAWISISLEVFIFLLISYILLTKNYIWDYLSLPFAIIICVFLAEIIYQQIESFTPKIPKSSN